MKPCRIIIGICLCIVLLFTVGCQTSLKNPTVAIENGTNIYSIKELYNLAEDYVDTYIGTNYELFKLSMVFDKTEDCGTAEFIYTKRSKHFRDVCFVRFDLVNKTISSSMQSEAQRLYGRDITVNVADWIIDLPEFNKQNNIIWDRLEVKTSYQNVVLTYYCNGSKIYVCERNPITNSLIEESFS